MSREEPLPASGPPLARNRNTAAAERGALFGCHSLKQERMGDAGSMKDTFSRATALCAVGLFNFHGSIMLLLLQPDYFLMDLSHFICIQKNQSPEEQWQQAVYYCTDTAIC